MKKALVVIAPADFEDYEYSATVMELEKNGIAIEVLSSERGICTGCHGTEIDAREPDEKDADEYDALVFIGGGGAIEIREDERFILLARKFAGKGKAIGAICWAPTILAKAGVLKGKKATIWVGFDSGYKEDTVAVIASFGAQFVRRPVVVDGNIITANGPSAAPAFGKMLAGKINEKQMQEMENKWKK